MSEHYSAIGLRIEQLDIAGEEFDTNLNRVMVDTLVVAEDRSKWLVSFITKKHFLSTEVQDFYDGIEDPLTNIEAIKEGLKIKSPYVLNDEDLSDDILRKKMLGREIGEDLAASMVFYNPDTE